MPSTLLFAVNSEGRVFGLSTNGTKWREFIYLGLEFKQLSAVPNFLWAVGGDRQIYVHTHGLDVPIRVKEEAYENERWTPFDGFSKRLLPTDRFNFSNQDGTIDRSLKKIRLPSMAWQWEGDWKLELTLDGQPLDHDGWTYAVDFPATYYSSKQWTSCVRRRKWIRYRRYIALNSWCAIAPLHKDPTKEPFIGVAAGGDHLPGAKSGTVLVWAVTASGRLMFRTGVSRSCPEGQRWNSVTMPPGCEVSQVAVGSTGLVWVVLWTGKAMVRTGVTRECVIGNGWVDVEQPEIDLMLHHVSIGHNGVWAITRDSRVWFRKGINGESCGISESLAKGTGWIEMCGCMSNISVASNDQVWAVGAEDKILYMRTSVTQEDLMGKTWRALGAPTQLSRGSSSTSLTFDGERELPKEKRHRSWASLNRPNAGPGIRSGDELDWSDISHSAPAVAARSHWQKSPSPSSEKFDSNLKNSSTNEDLPPSESCSENSIAGRSVEHVQEHHAQNDYDATDVPYESDSRPLGVFPNKDIAVPTRSWSPQHAGGTVVATEAHYAADSIVFESDEQLGIYSEHGEREDEDDHLYWTDSDAFWSTVEAGACLINVNHLPNWFADTITCKKRAELSEPWRVNILNGLRGRFSAASEDFQNYEKAIESSSWVRSGRCKCLLPNEANFKDCLIELEWVSGEEDCGDTCSTLTVSCPSKDESWVHVNMQEVTAVTRCGISRNPRLALFSRTTSAPLKLHFESEDEVEEWKSEISAVCCRIKNILHSPSSFSIWTTTAIGDIFVCDLSQVVTEQRSLTKDGHSVERLFSGNKNPVEIPLGAGFTQGASIIVWGCVPDGAKKFTIDFVCKGENGIADVIFHFNPRFDEGRVVQNSRENMIWGREESLRLPFGAGSLFEIEISCAQDDFIVSIDSKIFSKFATSRKQSGEREPVSECATHFNCFGDVCINKIRYSSPEIILEPQSMFWRQIEGHLKKVETSDGITWGIGFDNTAWLYAGTESSSEITRRIHDTRYYYAYENQRWNPLTGYTSHGLPTDRFMWSDVTGKHKRIRENTPLPSKKWRWVNDWTVDFHTPGGVDSEGWQYATDFPSSYHGTKTLTDYVRRRRWFKCAKLESSGPWIELGYTQLSDCSLYSDGDKIMAWAVASNGYVLFRKGVTRNCPAGLSWEHVSTDEKIVSIACRPNQVWAVGKSGTAICRTGITDSDPTGNSWVTVEAPLGASIKQITAGKSGVWALDAGGGIWTRLDVSEVFPFGSHWRTIPLFFHEENTFGTHVTVLGTYDDRWLDIIWRSHYKRQGRKIATNLSEKFRIVGCHEFGAAGLQAGRHAGNTLRFFMAVWDRS